MPLSWRFAEVLGLRRKTHNNLRFSSFNFLTEASSKTEKHIIVLCDCELESGDQNDKVCEVLGALTEEMLSQQGHHPREFWTSTIDCHVLAHDFIDNYILWDSTFHFTTIYREVEIVVVVRSSSIVEAQINPLLCFYASEMIRVCALILDPDLDVSSISRIIHRYQGIGIICTDLKVNTLAGHVSRLLDFIHRSPFLREDELEPLVCDLHGLQVYGGLGSGTVGTSVPGNKGQSRIRAKSSRRYSDSMLACRGDDSLDRKRHIVYTQSAVEQASTDIFKRLVSEEERMAIDSDDYLSISALPDSGSKNRTLRRTQCVIL